MYDNRKEKSSRNNVWIVIQSDNYSLDNIILRYTT